MRLLRAVACALALFWLLAGAALLNAHKRLLLAWPGTPRPATATAVAPAAAARPGPPPHYSSRLRPAAAAAAAAHLICPCRDRFSPGVHWHRASSSLRVRDEHCYIRAWSPEGAAEAILGAHSNAAAATTRTQTKTKWLVFLGDSSLRGVVLSLLKLLLDGDMHPDHVKWLGLLAPITTKAGGPSVDVGFLDHTLVYRGNQRQAVTSFRSALDKLSVQTSFSSVIRLLIKGNAMVPRTESSIRITYVMSRHIPDLLQSLLPRFGAFIDKADRVIFTGGTWDMSFLDTTPSLLKKRPFLDLPWFTDNKLRSWKDVPANKGGIPGYSKLFAGLNKWCRSRDILRRQHDLPSCVWLTGNAFIPGVKPRDNALLLSSDQRQGERLHSLWMRALKRQPFISLMDRWSSTRVLGTEHAVDGQHYDNAVNAWHVFQLVGMLSGGGQGGARDDRDGTCVERRRLPREYEQSNGCKTDFQGVTGRFLWSFRCVVRAVLPPVSLKT